MNWPKVLKAIRKAGLSKTEAAARVGVAANTWHRWETGAMTPGPLAARAIRTTFPAHFERGSDGSREEGNGKAEAAGPAAQA